MASIGEDDHQLLELCDLPDEILIRILSLLPTTQDAVRTCLLLFRRNEQQHLWKSLASLKFHFYDMLLRGSRFINFVERVMDFRDDSLPLVSYSLKYFIEDGYDADRFKTLITKAVQCNVQHLTLSLFRTSLPCCIFRCQSLVKLDLQFISIDVPSSSVVCLPRLKYLRLDEVTLVNGKSIEMLLSSPLLEVLIIDQCYYWDIQSIHVCSPKLQVLTIWDNACGRSTIISIIVGNLKCFSYMGNLHNEYWICASSSTQLTNVELYANEKMFGDLGLNCYDILKSLYRTQNLALSDFLIEGLQKFPELLDTVQVFECLARLDIQVYKKEMPIDSLALMKIYERCPHLKYLNIGKLSTTMRNPQLTPIPLCFQTTLKKILVHYYFPGDNKADAAINVLLNSALVLEDLVIYCLMDKAIGFHEGSRKIQELQDRLNRRPRVSKDCIISVRVIYYIKSSSRWSRSYYNKCYVKSMSESSFLV